MLFPWARLTQTQIPNGRWFLRFNFFFRRGVDKRWNGYGTSCMPFASLARIAYLCLVLIGSLRQLRCCDWLTVLLWCWFYHSHLNTTPLLLVKWLSLKATCCFLIDFLLFFFFLGRDRHFEIKISKTRKRKERIRRNERETSTKGTYDHLYIYAGQCRNPKERASRTNFLKFKQVDHCVWDLPFKWVEMK